MRPVPFWLNITKAVNVLFEVILALIRERHLVSSIRSSCADKDVVISNMQLKIICDISVLFRKWNSCANSIDRLHMTN